MSRLSESLRQQVINRACNRCEYCQLPAGISFYPHEVDHVIALKHGGQTIESNLAYACWRCNRYKGSDLGSFDPEAQIFCLILALKAGKNTLKRVIVKFLAKLLREEQQCIY